MTARDVDFLELRIERNVLPRAAGEEQSERLALKLARDIIVHIAEPGTLGD